MKRLLARAMSARQVNNNQKECNTRVYNKGKVNSIAKRVKGRKPLQAAVEYERSMDDA